MTPVPDNLDVVIAGAGIAGATLALALKSGGLEVAVVDPQPFAAQLAPTFDGRASAVSFACFRQWRALGVGERLEADAQPIREILVTDGRAPGAAARAPSPVFMRFEAAEIADRSDGEPLGYLIENRHIRAALAAAVREADIPVLAPAKVAGVERSGSARVALADGRILDAPLVVAADGKRSSLRAEAGIDVVSWRYPQSAVVATLRVEHDHGGVAYEHFLPSGPFAILPLTDRRVSLVWTEGTERARALVDASPQAFISLLRRRFGTFLGELEVEGPRFFYPLELTLAERIVAPRLALVGDAAHAVHPIAGQGLNMGLKDVAALAQVLVDAARLGEDLGAESVLERYARWRRVDNLAVTVATDAFTRLFSNESRLLRAARSAGLALVNRAGPARRFFMSEAGGAVGDLPLLLRGLTP